MEFKAKEILVQSFVFSNFNYCPLVWHFSSEKSTKKIEKIHERALRFLYGDHTSLYDDLLTTLVNLYALLYCGGYAIQRRSIMLDVVDTPSRKHNTPPLYGVSTTVVRIGSLGKCTMKISHLRTLCIEIYKTVSKLNPPFMQDIFKLKQTTRSARNPIELFIIDQTKLLSGQKVSYH